MQSWNMVGRVPMSINMLGSGKSDVPTVGNSIHQFQRISGISHCRSCSGCFPMSLPLCCSAKLLPVLQPFWLLKMAAEIPSRASPSSWTSSTLSLELQISIAYDIIIYHHNSSYIIICHHMSSYVIIQLCMVMVYK